MQTSFSPLQLQDHSFQSSNQVLRTCVHCGFCTATCPTFVLLGDELDSPRGRIYLIKDMLESGRPATEEVVRHVDRCLSCLSCMTTCPSGVNYMHLVDHARAYIEDTYTRPWHDRALRAVLARVLPRPAVFRGALRLAAAARWTGRLLPGQSMPVRRLRAMLALAPSSLPPAGSSARPSVHPAQGERRGPRRPAHRLRADRAGAFDQRSQHPAADAVGHRGRGRQRRRLLRRIDAPHGSP